MESHGYDSYSKFLLLIVQVDGRRRKVDEAINQLRGDVSSLDAKNESGNDGIRRYHRCLHIQVVQ